MKRPWELEAERAYARRYQNAAPNQWQHAVNIPPLRWTPTGLRRIDFDRPDPIPLLRVRRKRLWLILFDLTMTALAIVLLFAMALLWRASMQH